MQVTLEEMQQSDGAFAGSGSASLSSTGSLSGNSRKRKLNDITTLSDSDEEEQGTLRRTHIGSGPSGPAPAMNANGKQSKRRRLGGNATGPNGATGALQKGYIHRAKAKATKQIEVIVLD